MEKLKIGDMIDDKRYYKCGFKEYLLPPHACVFCDYCLDVVYDSNGIYLILCEEVEDPGNGYGCDRFKEVDS